MSTPLDVHTITPLFEADPFAESDERSDDVLSAARALLRRLERELLEVEQAVGRLETGGYGACDVCGVAIDPQRLAEDPAAYRCGAHSDEAPE